MKSILIDVDDTICQATFLDEINKFLSSDYTFDDLKEYDMSLLIKNEGDRTKFFNNLQDKDIYENAVIYDNAIDVIEKLSKIYDVYICSSCVFLRNKETSGIFFKYKYDFLQKHFPFLNPDKFIFTSAKNMINADIIIDDKLENMLHIKKRILFTAYHNKLISDKKLKDNNTIRANSWKEVEKLLLK